MAIYHLSAKTIPRNVGRSATAAAAYRAGAEVSDERTGVVHDYSRRRGVLHGEIITPASVPAWAQDRGQLWNAAERAETRKNATVAREIEVALPHELSPVQRLELVRGFARALAERHQVAVDVAIHVPHGRGDQRNHHAHLLFSTRRLTADGFGEKTREWDNRQPDQGLTGKAVVEHWRQAWECHANQALESAGVSARLDHRSLAAQGVERIPGIHWGPRVTAMHRRGDASGRTEQAQTVKQARAQLEQMEAEQLALEVQRRQEAALQAKRQQQLETEWRSRQEVLGPAPAEPAPRPAPPQAAPAPEPWWQRALARVTSRAVKHTAEPRELSALDGITGPERDAETVAQVARRWAEWQRQHAALTRSQVAPAPAPAQSAPRPQVPPPPAPTLAVERDAEPQASAAPPVSSGQPPPTPPRRSAAEEATPPARAEAPQPPRAAAEDAERPRLEALLRQQARADLEALRQEAREQVERCQQRVEAHATAPAERAQARRQTAELERVLRLLEDEIARRQRAAAVAEVKRQAPAGHEPPAPRQGLGEAPAPETEPAPEPDDDYTPPRPGF